MTQARHWRIALRSAAIAAAVGLALNAPRAWCASTNFPLASAPVPFPTFELGSLDSKLSGGYERVTDGTAAFNGASVNYKARLAPFSSLAVGLELPFVYLTGKLGSDGNDGSESLSTVAPVLNFQWLAIDSSDFSAIVFGGYNYNTGWGKADESSNGMPAHLSLSGSTQGFLVGAHLGVPIFNGIIFAPSYTFTRNFGGYADATITLDNGMVFDAHNRVAGFSSHGVGLDFIIPEPWFSVGALIQEVLAATASGSSLKVFVLEAAWHFGVPTKFRR